MPSSIGRILMHKNEKKRIAKILGEYLSGNFSSEVTEAVQGMILSDDNKDIKDEVLEELFHAKVHRQVIPDKETTDALKAVNEKLGFSTKNRRFRASFNKLTLTRVAAVMLPFIFTATATLMWINRDNGTPNPQIAVVTHTIVEVETESISMPDGSRISVSRGATISYNEDFKDKRSVFLTGEASFDVERDTARVFTVNTDHFKIEVLGTEFKVSSPVGEDNSTIELYHGSVLVEAGGQSMIMRPGDHLDYCHSTKEITISRTALEDRIYDNVPDLIFEGASLMDIFLTIERECGIIIRIDRQIENDNSKIMVDLSNARTIDVLMSILSRTTGNFTYEINDTAVLVKPLNN